MSELQTLKSDLTKTRIVDGGNDRVNLDEEEIIGEMQKIKKKDSPFWGR